MTRIPTVLRWPLAGALIACLTMGSALRDGALHAQAPTAPPFSCADTTRRVLGVLLGSYDAVAAFRAGPAAWDSSAARVDVTPELGGCVLREHFRGTRYGAPYEYVALWGAHGAAGRSVQRAFVHSQHGLLGVSDGAWVGDTLVLEDSAHVRGRWIHQRHLLWRAGAGELRSEGRRSEDGRRSWIVTQCLRLARRAGAAVEGSER